MRSVGLRSATGGAGSSPACLAATFALVGHELERAAVHAIAQPGGIRPVIEHMAEMGLAGGAANLRAGHEKPGQPEPESNLVSEVNNGLPQLTHKYMPLRFSSR